MGVGGGMCEVRSQLRVSTQLQSWLLLTVQAGALAGGRHGRAAMPGLHACVRACFSAATRVDMPKHAPIGGCGCGR